MWRQTVTAQLGLRAHGSDYRGCPPKSLGARDENQENSEKMRTGRAGCHK